MRAVRLAPDYPNAWCRSVADTEGAAGLRRLDVTGCTLLNDDALMAIGRCRKMTHLRLAKCGGFGELLAHRFAVPRSPVIALRVGLRKCQGATRCHC